MYAKPIAINIKYNNIDKHILYCIITDTFNSIIHKILLEYKINAIQYTIKQLQYTNGHIDTSNFNSFIFNNSDIYTFETVKSTHNANKNDKPYEHKFVHLKCTIDDEGGQKKIKLPSKNADKHLESVLTRIPKKFPIVSVVDWIMEINGNIINKTNSQQFAKVLSKTAPPAIIEIIEKQQYKLYIHYGNNKFFVYNQLGFHGDINKWNKMKFDHLMKSIQTQCHIKYYFFLFADKRCIKYDIWGIESLKKAFADRYNLDIYIKHQLKIKYGSNSFLWKPPSVSIENIKQWNEYYNQLKHTIANKFKLPFDELELTNINGCIDSTKQLIITYQTFIKNSQDIKIKKKILLKLKDIKDITYKHNRMGSAVNELYNKIPFIQKQTCYDIIMDALCDNNKSMHTDVLLDEQKIDFEIEEKWTQKWQHIAKCVQHEMFGGLSSTIKSTVDREVINIGEHINDKTVAALLRILKFKRNLEKEEAEYLRKLIERYREFNPNKLISIKKWDGKDIKHDFKMEECATWKGLNISILNDIFNVHRSFIFGTYHFEEYTSKRFVFDINNNRFLGKKFTEKYLPKNIEFKAHFNFYPSYLINDNLFEIVKYFFGISHYVHDIEKNGEIENKNDEKEEDDDDDDDKDDEKEILFDDVDNVKDASEFRLYSVIIPKESSCVYDNKLLFQRNIGNIDEYLLNKNIYNYHRNIIRLNTIQTAKDIKRLLIKYYNVNDIKQDESTQVVIIIDRRGLNDILYIFSTNDMNDFNELQCNYFIGFDFCVLFGHLKGNNVSKCYLRYGIGDKLRFYPELLESIIPRLFVKHNNQELINNMYNNNYKHGFCLRLHDPIFNKYYKIITNFTFISVNYNRSVVIDDYKEDHAEVLFFSDILSIQISKYAQNNKQVEEFNKYLKDNDYDSDAILFDLGEDENIEGEKNDIIDEKSFIKHYFMNKKQDKNWKTCREYIKKFNRRRSEENEKKQSTENKQNDNDEEKKESEPGYTPGAMVICNKTNTISIEKCPYVSCIIDSLQIFEKMKYNIDSDNITQFDLSYLSQSYDHIINVHKFCKKQYNEESEQQQHHMETINEIKKYFYDKLGMCNDKMKCPVLQQHANRKRERGANSKENKRKENNDNKRNINNNNGEADGEVMIEESKPNSIQNNLGEMLNALLNSIHTYVLHSDGQLWRLQGVNIDGNGNGNNNKENRFTTPTISVSKDEDRNRNININTNKFTTPLDINTNKFTTPLSENTGPGHMRQDTIIDELEDDSDDDGKDDTVDANVIYSINFGDSVLEWLLYGEKSSFKTFHQEIVNNPISTIDEKLFLSFKQECFIKSITNKGEYYTIIELLSLKLYTDTTIYQSQLRKAFWTTSKKEIRKNFYLWALHLYKTQLYHSIPVPISESGRRKGKPTLIYHGLNNVFIVDRSLPMYNGPISTTLDKSVALSFSDAKGLIWNIKCSYINPFKLIKGISVSWISQFKHEAEFLLINQYLPIDKTKNFQNDDSNNVDHLLYTLKAANNKITNPKSFYAQIGFSYKKQFTDIIKKHSALYKSTSIGNIVSILQRLYEELNLKNEFKYEYKIISSKFKIYDHKNVNNYFRLKINDTIYQDDENKVDCFFDCKYKIIAINDNKLIEDIEKVKCKYNDEIIIKNNIKYKIYVKNKKLFLRNNYILLQEIEPIIFDDDFSNSFYNNLQLNINKNAIILNPYKSIEMDDEFEEEDEYEDDDEDEYEDDEEEEEEYDVKRDIYDIINEKTKKQILSAKYILKLSIKNIDDDEFDEKQLQTNNVTIYKCKNINNFIIPLSSMPAQSKNINTIHGYKLYVQFNNNNKWLLFKTFYFTEYIFNNKKNDIIISNQININTVEDGGGSIQIFSKSSIIINKNGIINANYCGFNNMCLQNIYDYNHINNVENDDDDDDEHMCLKYGKTKPSDEDYDAVVLGGGIIELISEKNIINNGKIITNGGTIKIYAKNNFKNNGQILSTIIDSGEGGYEDSIKYNGNIYIQCGNNINEQQDEEEEKTNGLILPPPTYIKYKIDGFSDIERVICKNEHKINISIAAKNGKKRDDTDPINLLSNNDSYYMSKDLKLRSGIDNDWIIFKMDNPHFIRKILIQNHAQKNGIKLIELQITNEENLYKNNNNWYKLCTIDKIRMNKQIQIFEIKSLIDIDQIVDEKLYYLKLKIIQNHGHGKSNRFYQFQVFGKLIYDVICTDDD